MSVMTIADLHRFLNEHFPQAPPDLKIEHLDDTTIRVRLPTHQRHLRPGGAVSGPTLMALVDAAFICCYWRIGPVARPSPRISISISAQA
jgi:acyl-coenzyme A thioesterase PaaI-like protein